MRIAVMQPYLFPYIGYWQLINHVDTFIIYDDVNFINRGYINRNYLLQNNNAKLFTLELISASQNRKINEISIGNNSNKLLKTIRQNYSKAPYFTEVFSLIKDIFEYPNKRLSSFVGNSLIVISRYLDLDTEFIYSSSLQNNKLLNAQDRLIEISKIFAAKYYVNSIGGEKLYQKSAFKNEGINLCFINNKDVDYKQFSNDFVPNLSIIDVMMFNKKEEVRIMLNQYQIT